MPERVIEKPGDCVAEGDAVIDGVKDGVGVRVLLGDGEVVTVRVRELERVGVTVGVGVRDGDA